MTERRADEATREVSDWLKCDFMQDQVGNIFSGVIAQRDPALASSSA
ncbi:3'-to-5' exoribonuclease RNase R [Klebsiella pneumoniae]|uniref:3'-to-5' exoribonuclease RNase R n=1 Tax=Klebsiella pneumoniae TaxID=573 RepID=A0A378B742_KLEPN|nr:3'-to-5' exoribonuclease RNase R [Klebsiella pneumoniae]